MGSHALSGHLLVLPEKLSTNSCILKPKLHACMTFLPRLTGHSTVEKQAPGFPGFTVLYSLFTSHLLFLHV